MTVPSAVIDIFALLLLIICVLWYAKKGFLQGLLSLFGTLFAAFASFMLAKKVAPAVFDSFVRPGFEDRLSAALAEQGELTVQSIQSALGSVADFLPAYAVDGAAATVTDGIAAAPASFASTVVSRVIAPFVTPVIVLVLFILFFLSMRFVFGAVGFVIRQLTKLPVLSTANTALGAVMGVFVAGVYIFLIVTIIRTGYTLFSEFSPTLSPVNPIDDSLFYKLFSGINWFG